MMGLYDNNLFYVVLCTSVLMLQVLWLLLSSSSPVEVTSRSRELLTFAVCSVFTALAASSFFRLFPGNVLPPSEDSSVFLYIGKRMLEGKLPYRDLFDHKGPILYFIECLGLRLSHGKTDGVWMLEVLNLLWTSVLMLRFAVLVAKNRSSCYLAVMMTVIVCGWKIWQGGNYTEEYALPWITIAALVFFRFFQTGSYRLRVFFLIGFSFAVVFLLRANMIAVWVAYLPLVLFFFLREKQYSNLGKCAALFLLGISAVFLPVLVWAEKSGVLPELWEDYILFNFSYTANAAEQGNSVFQTALLFAGVVWPGTVAQLLCLVFDFRNRGQWLNALFFAISLLAASMSARGYYHYAIILLPSIVFPLTAFFDLSGCVWCRLFKKSGVVDYRLILFSFFLIAATAFLYRVVSPGKLQENQAVQILQDRTNTQDDVLVLGNNCYYYLEADRKTENRFFYQLPPLEISRELYIAFEEELDRHLPDAVLIPGEEEERERTDFRLKGIREKLLNRGYSIEEYDGFELLIHGD